MWANDMGKINRQVDSTSSHSNMDEICILLGMVLLPRVIS